jgi:subtilisin family serine protease
MEVCMRFGTIFVIHVILCALVLIAVPSGFLRAGTLDDSVVAEINQASSGTNLSVLVTLAQQFDVPGLEREMRDLGIRTRWRRHEFVVRRAQELASGTQAPILAELESGLARGTVASYRPFWVTNAIALNARPQVIAALSLRGDVGMIYPDSPIPLRLASDSAPPAAPREGNRHLEDALVCINVLPAWDLGYNGRGRLVCDFDTGADGYHYAYASRWRGNQSGVNWWEAWRDPYNHTEFPYDSQSHGTHTLGIMVANPPDSAMTGVAPEAQWIAAGVLIQWDVTKILDCYQWAIDPDGDPSTIEDVPDVINNSWGTSDDCDETFWNAIDLVEAAGIVNTIAVDNTGPAPFSVNSPESRAQNDYVNFGVGNVDPHTSGYPIFLSSGRGPSPCDSTSIKPNITAPGTTIYSTIPGGGYTWKTGCSMACPHTSGAAAILRQVNPSLTVEQIKQAMMLTASDHGDPGPDNTYGWGILDVGAAVNWVLSNYPPPEPPSGLSAWASADSVFLSWTAPEHIPPADPLAGYAVYRASGLGPFPDTPLADTRADETTYIDSGLTLGTYRYVVTTLYEDGTESEPSNQVIVYVNAPPSAVAEQDAVAAEAALEAWPNPFSSGTELTLRAPAEGTTSIEIFNAGGEKVRTLSPGSGDPQSRPWHVVWDGRDDQGHAVRAGTYFALARTGEGRLSRRLVVLR